MNSGNSQQPLMVSIKCLVYNHAPYLRQCLEGFVMQKTNFRFEAIVHDDASTDGSVEIISEYAKKYPEIIIPIYETENQYFKPDGSLKRIMNAACKGKYIAHCEGDDYWIDPLKLQKQVDFMESHQDYTLCGSNGLILWDNGIHSPKYFNNCFKSRQVLLKELVDYWFFPTASLLYRREINDNYPEWTKQIYSGDQTLILLNYNRGNVYCLSDLTCVYRKSIDNVYSISNKSDKTSLFVPKQHLLLYELFNEYTERKFSDVIDLKIKQLKNEIKYLKQKNKFALLPFILNPIYSFKYKLVPKIKRFLYKLQRFL